jgi:hypothetical protein
MVGTTSAACKPDELDAVGEAFRRLSRHLRHEAGLADATEAREGEQPDFGTAEEITYLPHLALASHQQGQRNGQGRFGERFDVASWHRGEKIRPFVVGELHGVGQRADGVRVGMAPLAAL